MSRGAAVRVDQDGAGDSAECRADRASGHEHGQPPLGPNMRNGARVKTVLTEIGPVLIEVP
jgi:hypothetical protein